MINRSRWQTGGIHYSAFASGHHLWSPGTPGLTILIESAFSVADDTIGRVKRWRGGDMRLLWTAAGLLMAEKQFRRNRGCKLMPELLAVLDCEEHGVEQSSRAA